MGVYLVELEDGSAFEVDADSPEDAQAAVMGGAPAPQAPEPSLGQKASKWVDILTPVGSAKELYGQAMGSRPSSPLRAGFAAADLASLGLATKAKAAYGATRGAIPFLSQVAKNVAPTLAIGAASAGTSEGLQQAGAPAALAIPAGIAAGVLTGRGVSPEMAMKAVPQGQEAQALSRAVQKMGLPVPAPLTNAPEDVARAWTTGREALGEAVGKAKQAALQTALPAEQVIERVQRGIGRTSAAVSPEAVIGGKVVPSATPNRKAAEFVANVQADIAETIPEGLPANQVMKILNNKLEAAKSQLSTQAAIGEGVPGRMTGKAISRWQRVLDSLGPQEQVQVAKATDKAFSKLVDLQDMVTSASSKKVGQTPGFNPRDFIFDWARAKQDPSILRKFSPEERQILDALTEQKPDSALQKAAQWVIKQKKNIGTQALTFHPTARFYEEGARMVGPKALRQAGAAQGREESERPTTFYNSLSR